MGPFMYMKTIRMTFFTDGYARNLLFSGAIVFLAKLDLGPLLLPFYLRLTPDGVIQETQVRFLSFSLSLGVHTR